MIFSPLVSIIIPVYNGSRYMREAIDSALAQTYQNKEIIIINDGSRDDGKTLAIARSYGDEVRIIDKQNGGVATALNAGIEEARGDYISWLSHDDVYPANKLQQQINYLSSLENKSTVLFGDYDIIDENGNIMGTVSTSCIDTSNMLFELYSNQIIHGCTLLMPKAMFEKSGTFRTDLPTTQDYDLWIRTSLHFPFSHVPGKYVYSRQHAEQGSRTMQHREELIAWYIENLNYISPQWLNSRYPQNQLIEKYDILLKKFSTNDLKPVYERVLLQARSHLAFKNTTNIVWFLTRSRFIYYTGTLKGAIKRMIPLTIKNLFRRGLNAPRNNSGKPNTLDFINIYKKNVFGSNESHSGTGSTMEQTAYIRSVLPDLFREFGVKTILDAPCGDFNWMQHVDLSGIHYIGGDIVPDLINKDQEKFGSDTVEFRALNIITDDLPKVDLILCRDCLVHLKFEDGLKAIENFKRSGATYLLTTSFTDRKENEDLFGIWRTLNLQKAPYNLPEPIKVINERCTEGKMKFTDKALVLWALKDI